MDAFLGLVKDLTDSDNFGQGSQKVVVWLMGSVSDTLKEQPHYDDVTLVRAMLHARSDTSYDFLSIVPPVDQENSGWALKPSTTVWRLIEKHSQSVALNVNLSVAKVRGIEEDVHLSVDSNRKPNVSTTIQSLESRDITHVLAIPLLNSYQKLEGMVSFEFQCPAIARLLPFEELFELLEPSLRAITPLLFSLPIQGEIHQEYDVLPVDSSWVREKYNLLSVLAGQMQPLLIQGPTGVGKTFLARWVHANSPQSHGSFVEARLNQIPDEAALPHLFGWRKGAYTGSVNANEGWATEAEGGTLFLDEIDTLTLSQQFGLLEFLDTGTFAVMGGAEAKELKSVRFVFATNADLPKLVSEGKFREDLYHRINTLAIELPGINQRKDEISGWLERFCHEFVEDAESVESVEISSELEELIAHRAYHGNLRELRRTAFQYCALAMANNAIDASGKLIIGLDVVADDDNFVNSFAGELFHDLNHLAHEIVEAAVKSEVVVHSRLLEGRSLLHDAIWLSVVERLGDPLLGTSGDRNRAASLLNKTTALRNNNYGAELKRACQRIATFCSERNEKIPESVVKILK